MSAAGDGGTRWDILNVTISGTDTEVTYGQPTKSFALWSRNNKVLQWRKTALASDYVTFYPGDKAAASAMLTNALANLASFGFFRTADGTADVIEGVVTY